MFKEYRVSVWEDEKVLEIEDDDGCTTMWLCLISLDCTLKTVKMVNFMLCIFYCNNFFLEFWEQTTELIL